MDLGINQDRSALVLVMNAAKLIKENQGEIRGPTDVTATFRHKEDRKGGFGSGLRVLMA